MVCYLAIVVYSHYFYNALCTFASKMKSVA